MTFKNGRGKDPCILIVHEVTEGAANESRVRDLSITRAQDRPGIAPCCCAGNAGRDMRTSAPHHPMILASLPFVTSAYLSLLINICKLCLAQIRRVIVKWASE